MLGKGLDIVTLLSIVMWIGFISKALFEVPKAYSLLGIRHEHRSGMGGREEVRCSISPTMKQFRLDLMPTLHSHLRHVLPHDDISARVEYNLDVLRISSTRCMVVDFTLRICILSQEFP
jgi:hypothetical protein